MIRSAFAAALLVFSAASLAQPTRVTTRQVGTARLENVPEIPAEVRAAVQRYQNYRAAQFQDWLPDGGMLITTRFGATNQVHRVAAPLRTRAQLTFHDEPVANAQTITGRDAFLYGRDTGGDEWFQIYSRNLAGGDTRQLTEPGTRNQSLDIEPRRTAARLVAGEPRLGRLCDHDRRSGEPGEPARRLAGHRRGRPGRHLGRQPAGADRARRSPIARRGCRSSISAPARCASSPGAVRRRPATRSRASSGAAGRSSPLPMPAATCAGWWRSTSRPARIGRFRRRKPLGRRGLRPQRRRPGAGLRL